MEIGGKKLSVRATKRIVIPRPDGQHLVFSLAAVLDMEERNKVLQEPEPPMINIKGKLPKPDLKDKVYLEKLDRYHALNSWWLLLKSLEATPGLKFNTVKMDDPETWPNVEREMIEAGLSTGDRAIIIDAAMQVNNLDTDEIERAAKDFFAAEAAEEAEAQNTPSP